MRTGTRATYAAVVLAALAALGGGAAAQGAVEPEAAPELMLTISVGPDATLDGVRAFASAVQPGAGAVLTAQVVRGQLAAMAGATSLDGLDPAANLYVLALDGAALSGRAIVGKVADAQRLKGGLGAAAHTVRNGWAIIGPQPVVDRVAAYAAGRLAAEPVLATAPVIELHTSNLLARIRPQLAEVRKQLESGAPGNPLGAAATRYFDAVVSSLEDSERVVISFDLSKTSGAAELSIAPRAGSPLAKFVAAQRPSDYALLGKLPAGTPAAVLAGRVTAGPYRAALAEVTSLMYGQPPPKDFTAAIGAVMQASSGEIALALSFGAARGMGMTYLFGVDDAKAADRAIRVLLEGFLKPVTTSDRGIKRTIAASARPEAHDGVTIRGYEMTIDASGMEPAQREAFQRIVPGGTQASHVALFDGLGAIATEPTGTAAVRAAIDAARGKAKRYAPAAAVADFLAASRARKESAVMIMDLGSIVAQAVPSGALPPGAAAAGPVMMSLGFAGQRRMNLRLTIPTAAIRALAGQQP